MGKDDVIQETGVAVEEIAKEPTAEEDAAFDSGFEGKVDEPTVTPPAETTVASNEPETVGTAETVPAGNATAEPVKEADKPSLTDAQLQEILTKVKTVDQFTAVVDKLRGDAFGKIGGLERTLKQLLEQTPTGQPIEVKAEDLKGIETEFPGLNLAPALAKDLTAVLSKMKVSAPGAGSNAAEIDAVKAELAAVKAARVEDAKIRAAERLSDMHEDWQELIGVDGQETEFRSWLKKEKPDQEKPFLESWDPKFVGRFLTEFKKAKAEREKAPTPPAPKAPTTRAQRLAEAVPAKSGGAPAPTPKRSEEEDAFDQGFNG